MKIFAISDLHMDFELLENIDADTDMILIAGDFTNYGVSIEIKSALLKLESIKESNPDLEIVICFGNHDIYAEENMENLKKNFPKIHILHNEVQSIKGLKIYGSPYTRAFMGWGFQYYSIEECKELTIPKEEVDVILNHEPVSDQVLSYTLNSIDIGNNELLKYLYSTDKQIVVIGGHCHENGGKFKKINNSCCYNVSRKGTYISIR